MSKIYSNLIENDELSVDTSLFMQLQYIAVDTILHW